ncbi:unnamed protein product [Durusdinium trenchii]|uniref:PDZ domain-containing protein n=1 Tax=Durusdinium trenchii TaxID=1381693 RepID=A0ABP0JH33_9DINO
MFCESCCVESGTATEVGVDERTSPMDIIESHPGNYVYDVQLGMVIVSNTQGAVVSAWNDSNPPSRQIGMYDRIVKVEGELGQGGKDIMKKIAAKVTNGVQVTMQRPQERTVTVERTARLGMNLNYRKGTHAKPWISSIEDGNCLIDQWNKTHPTHSVAVNDRVISVNGSALSAVDTVETLRTATGTLTIKFVHFD